MNSAMDSYKVNVAWLGDCSTVYLPMYYHQVLFCLTKPKDTKNNVFGRML